MSAARDGWPARVALLAFGAAVAGLLGWWRADRTRAWETPFWNPHAFVRLDAGAAGGLDPVARTAERDRPLWVVPVNPACPQCVAGLGRAFATRNARRSPSRIVALVVDVRSEPKANTLAALHADAHYWDRDGVWRTRWGHRVYGEALLFTPGGRHLRTLAPGPDLEAALPPANLGVPPDDL